MELGTWHPNLAVVVVVDDDVNAMHADPPHATTQGHAAAAAGTGVANINTSVRGTGGEVNIDSRDQVCTHILSHKRDGREFHCVAIHHRVFGT